MQSNKNPKKDVYSKDGNGKKDTTTTTTSNTDRSSSASSNLATTISVDDTPMDTSVPASVDKESAKDILDARNDEFESLITLHGILCAFLLSIALSVQEKTTISALGFTSFMGPLAKHQEFRTYVHEIMDKQGYEWNVTVSPNVVLDVQHELLTGISERIDNCEISSDAGAFASYNCVTLTETSQDKKLMQVAALLYPHFPNEHTTVFLLENEFAYKPYVSMFSAGSCALLIGGLLGNLFMYMAFLLSDAREDRTGIASKDFISYAKCCVLLQYCTLAVSIILMIAASNYYLANESPFAKDEYEAMTLYVGLVSGQVVVFSLYAIFAWYKSQKNETVKLCFQPRCKKNITVAPTQNNGLATH